MASAAMVAPYAGVAKAGWIFIVPMVIGGVIRLLMEWQLRLTVAEIFKRAPDGSVVVIRKRGLGGSMWIQVGNRPVPGGWHARAELR